MDSADILMVRAEFEVGCAVGKVRRKQAFEVAFAVRVFLWAVLGAGVAVIAMHVGNARSEVRQHIPVNPITTVDELAKGKLHWPREATPVAIVEIGVVALGLFALALIRRHAASGQLGIDAKARLMATGKVLGPITEAGARATAEKLGVHLGYDDPPGAAIGIAVAGGELLYGSYEDLHLDIWGPRYGKSTCRAMPAILEAIGPVIVTSSKRDLVDATREVREMKGSRVFVFDPQGIADEQPGWSWNPLSWVGAHREGCEMRAARLAGHFADSADSTGSTRSTGTDDFFDREAEDLLKGLFLAAAVGGRPITQVWDWVTNPNDSEPHQLLLDDKRYRPASGLSAQYNTDWHQRDRIFRTAKRMIRCLEQSEVHPWITAGSDRPELDELDFLERNGTLYILALEGRGSATPLASALAEAVIDVAMRKGAHSTNGRLAIPLLAVLDDAAHVVRWRDFPQRCSFYGSRGIVVMTMLQSWAQGVRCWGPNGMAELWSAATIKVVGGGVDEVPFLRDRVDGIGSHDVEVRSVTISTSGLGYSTSISSANTLGVSDLRSLPRGRALLFASGIPPVLIRTRPWWEGEYADYVRQSLRLHPPGPVRSENLLDPDLATIPPPVVTDVELDEIRPL